MISVILPMYNEEFLIGETLRRLKTQKGSYECIVVDGGSRDRSVAKAKPYAEVLSSEKGRAFQMNAGARRARGDVFLFLHADSSLEEGALEAIEKAMEEKEVVGGCLTQKIDASHLFYRFLEFSGTMRAKFFRLFYGDQALFVRRQIFDKLQGYPPLPLFEDLAFSRLLRREGKIVILSKRVLTSARRWEENGMLRGSCRNLALLFLYGIGIAPERLSKFYANVR